MDGRIEGKHSSLSCLEKSGYLHAWKSERKKTFSRVQCKLDVDAYSEAKHLSCILQFTFSHLFYSL